MRHVVAIVKIRSAKAFPPDHGGAQIPLRFVVGGFDAGVIQAGKKSRPVPIERFAEGANFGVRRFQSSANQRSKTSFEHADPLARHFRRHGAVPDRAVQGKKAPLLGNGSLGKFVRRLVE